MFDVPLNPIRTSFVERLAHMTGFATPTTFHPLIALFPDRVEPGQARHSLLYQLYSLPKAVAEGRFWFLLPLQSRQMTTKS